MEKEKIESEVLPKTGDAQILNIIHEIPVAEIYVNEQVRKTFDNEDLAGLAQSIKENGLIQPITVKNYLDGVIKKEVNGKKFSYELVTGERRLRAVKLLKADTIRAMIQNFNRDMDVLAVQIIENLQRVDLHPMEEAWGYNQLVEVNKLSRRQIAEKVGKSLSYIDKRVQLMKLFPEAQKLFRENKFSVSHAIEIARLDSGVQKKLVEKMFRPYDGTYTDLEDTKRIIQSEIMTDLSSAIFDRKDMELVKKAGACTACFKNTSCHETLFDDIAPGKSFCTDKLCFNNKTKVFLANKITAAEEKGMVKISPDPGGKVADILYSGSYTIINKDDKKCGSTKKAVLVKTGYDEHFNRMEKGQTKTVCDDPSCKVHHNKKQSVPTDVTKEDEKNLKRFGTELIKDIENEKFNLGLIDAISGQVTEKNFNKFFDLIIAKLFHELDNDVTSIIFNMWGVDREKVVFNYDFAKTYKEIRTLKLTNKIEKIAYLLFAHELDPDSRDNSKIMYNFIEENFKAIKIPEIKKKITAEVEGIKIADYKAVIKKCKVDEDFAIVAKGHLDEIIILLKDAGIEKYPPYDNKSIWDGKKFIEDIYSLPAKKLLGLVEHVANENKETALKLHQLVMLIPDIKKCSGTKNN